MVQKVSDKTVKKFRATVSPAQCGLCSVRSIWGHRSLESKERVTSTLRGEQVPWDSVQGGSSTSSRKHHGVFMGAGIVDLRFKGWLEF